MPKDKSPFGTYLLIALVAVGAAAGGYYFGNSINQSMNMMTRMRWKRMKMNPKIQNLKSGK